MTVTWEWVLAASADGTNRDYLTGARDKRLDFVRNTPATATCTLAHEDAAAATLLSLINVPTTVSTIPSMPILLAYRSGTLRFAGILEAVDEEVDDGSSMALTFRSPQARFFKRLYPGGAGTFIAGSDGASILDQLNKNATYGQWAASHWTQISGTLSGGSAGSLPGDFTAQKYQTIAELAESMQALQTGGFDFEYDPIAPTLTAGHSLYDIANLHRYATQGSDKPAARFEYGGDTIGNVDSVRRTITPPVNNVVVTGATGAIGTASDATSISRYGAFDAIFSEPSISDTTTLNARAADKLRAEWVRTVEFSPNADLAPQPWTDYWLGDTIRFNARRGAFEESLSPRVNAIGVDIDESGVESHRISFEQAV